MKITLAALSLLLTATCTPLSLLPQFRAVNDYDWPSYAQSPASTKYAGLDQINKKTVKDLQIAWSWSSVDNEAVELRPQHVPLGYKATPLKIGNMLYTSTTLGSVVALDAATGEKIWAFDTKTWEHGRPANIGFNHKGVSYWASGDKKRILMATNNAFLWSLDAATGLPDESFGNGGKVDLTEGLGRPIIRALYSVTTPPMIVDNTIVVGSVVTDGPRAGFFVPKRAMMPPGHVRGFDVATGKQKWIFHTIPQGEEAGVETWENDSWKDTGSTNVWTMMSADPELGYVYLPIGTPNNDYYGGERLGDNLFGESLVCLDAETGKEVWHFQMVHHGLWDYDLGSAPNLVDIEVDGKPIKAVAQVSKQGFIYVFDRVTGEPVWPIEERAVPTSSVPGERTSPTQPFPTRPAPFELQGLSDETIIDYTPELRAEALKIISKFEHHGLFTPPSLKGTINLPGDGGGANWGGAGIDPETGTLFVTSMSWPMVIKLEPLPQDETEYRYARGGDPGLVGPQGLPLTKPPYSRVSAIDLNTGDYKWVVANGEGIRQQIIKMGIPDPGPTGDFTFPSHTLVTKSLLFVTIQSPKPLLKALDKETGATLQEIRLPATPNGAPMTYMVDGDQYISIAVGGGKDARLVTYSLAKEGGPAAVALLTQSELDTEQIYDETCSTCHATGLHGAPRPGFMMEWVGRVAGGLEPVYANTKRGLGTHMPPRGQCSDCSDEQLEALVDFMVK